MGMSIVRVFLFYTPQHLAIKASTGELMGEYLMNTTPRNYSNLSNAIVSEGYINFGFFGVVLAIILAYFIVKFISWMISKNYFKSLFHFILPFICVFVRGDLTNGVSILWAP